LSPGEGALCQGLWVKERRYKYHDHDCDERVPLFRISSSELVNQPFVQHTHCNWIEDDGKKDEVEKAA
jgi:hypothetical protein